MCHGRHKGQNAVNYADQLVSDLYIQISICTALYHQLEGG